MNEKKQFCQNKKTILFESERVREKIVKFITTYQFKEIHINVLVIL